MKNQYNLLPFDFKNRKMYEGVISTYANDANILASSIKFLSGVGRNFQPLCLNWLKKAMPSQEDYAKVALNSIALRQIEVFVQQIYEDHREQVLRDGRNG